MIAVKRSRLNGQQEKIVLGMTR